jgi:Fanconi anemia group M protein
VQDVYAHEEKVGRGGRLERREYQVQIAESASRANTLVVLPTGLGKTIIAILVAERRLAELERGRVVVLAPTRPLVAQHHTAFEKYFKESACSHLTGLIRPQERVKVWAESEFIFATPQVVANDVRAERYSLEDVCLMVFDEAHRCVKDYDYTHLALKYQQSATDPLILGLTASPGGKSEQIQLVCENLFIKQVEVRSEYDEDVQPYVHSIAVDWQRVPLPESYRAVSRLLRNVSEEKVRKLKTMRLLPNVELVPKKMLLDLRQQLIIRLRKKRSGYIFAALTLQGQAMSILHAIELIETQDARNLKQYFIRMSENPKRTIKSLLKDRRVQTAIELTDNIHVSHPKLAVLSDLVAEQLRTTPTGRVIVFTQYRDTVELIVTKLQREGIRPIRFVGHATGGGVGLGLSQKEQLETLDDFKAGTYNVLVTTSIGEEGLDVPVADIEVWLDPPSNPKKWIQRFGRILRQSGEKRSAKTYALLSMKTHEKKKLLGVMSKVEKVYGFTQRVSEEELPKSLPKEQKRLSQFL